jgi:cytochrome P450
MMADEPGNLRTELFLATAVEEPQPLLAELLANSPVVHTDRGVSFLRMADVLEANHSRDVYGVGGGRTDRGSMGGDRPLIPLDLDGPEHTKYRKLLDPLFAPRKIAGLEPRIRTRTVELLDGFADTGKVDAYSEFCSPLPSSIFLSIMGIPESDLEYFMAFERGIINHDVDLSQIGNLEARFDEMREAGKKCYAYFNAELDKREALGQPGDDLIGWFLSAEQDGQRLTREEILDITYLLMIAGLDTVVSTLSLDLHWLAKHPAERSRLVAEPELWPSAIEELLRWECPVAGSGRTAARDLVVNGVEVKAGESIRLSLAAANLDPEIFEDPLTVDITRKNNRHVAFTSGWHRCLGSHLARLELRVALEEWHKRIPDYRIADEQSPRFYFGAPRAVDYLPLVWDV